MQETEAVSGDQQDHSEERAVSANSKKQLLKSTGILGSAQLIIILFGVVRVKVLAVLLGPVGVGIAGIYQSLADLLRTATGLGLWGSAVRDISTSAATGNQKTVAETRKILSVWIWFTGLAGMLLAIIFCRQLSQWAFDSSDYSGGIAILSVGILLTSLSEGQYAVLQGLRQIRALAKAKIFSAFVVLIGSVVIYWFWGMAGIIPVLLLTPLASFIWYRHYTRRIEMVPVKLSFREIYQRGKSMAVLGFFLSMNALASTATLFLVRSFITYRSDLTTVGYFTAAWAVSFMYLSAIFGTMSSDYYPRLSAVQNDHPQMRRLINEQVEITLLITAPAIIMMITYVDVIVRLFYSKEFGLAAQILVWQLAGDFFKALVWPMGFARLAKGKGKTYLLTELVWNVVYLTFVVVLWPYVGILSTGVSFLIAFVVQLAIIYRLTQKLIAFRFSREVLNCLFVLFPLFLVAFSAHKFLSGFYAYFLGSIVSLAAAYFSFIKLKRLIPIEGLLSKMGLKKK